MSDYFDTSVVVASLVASHPHHSLALSAVTLAEGRSAKPCICSLGLAETFAALTRLPLRPPMSASVAEVLITHELATRFRIEPVATSDELAAIRMVVAAGRAGSIVHDALHVAVARRIGVARLWTFNVAHFEPFWDSQHVRAPGDGA